MSMAKRPACLWDTSLREMDLSLGHKGPLWPLASLPFISLHRRLMMSGRPPSLGAVGGASPLVSGCGSIEAIAKFLMAAILVAFLALAAALLASIFAFMAGDSSGLERSSRGPESSVQKLKAPGFEGNCPGVC